MNIEVVYVTNFYNSNAKSFNDTRYLPWPIVKTFINNLSPHTTICDIGCGNGKNQFRNDLNWHSCDSSKELCKFVKNATLADCTSLPYNSLCFDSIICIAVLHHLSTYTRRLQALREIKRTLKANGTALISVWAAQEKYGIGDQLVSWNHKQMQRYIHFFTYTEVNELVSSVFDSYKIILDYNNYYVFIQN